jgi:hypothetical protein
MQDSFSLPRLPNEGPGRRELLSFDRMTLVAAGSYEPSGEAVIYDPIWSGARYPEAIVVHETIHQYLSINTTFGFFTQLVKILTRRGQVEGALSHCRQSQWSVQELAATYCELGAVAEIAPDQLDEEIRRLPSQYLGQPPYREIFESIAPYLPLTDADDVPTVKAMTMLVQMLAFAAMNSDCLRRATKTPPTADGVLACMSDEPNDRLERLIRVLAETGAFPELLDRTKALLAEKAADLIALPPAVYALLQSAAPTAIRWERDDLQTAVEPVLAAWDTPLAGVRVDHRSDGDPFPKFGFSPEQARDTIRRHAPRELAAGAIAERAKAAAGMGHGLIIEIALRDSSLAHVKLGAYLLENPSEPWPANDPPKDAGASIPPDITGLATLEMILEEFAPFMDVPRIVSLLDPGWRHFTVHPDAHVILRNGIGICRLTELSKDTVWGALRFGNHGGRFILLRLTANYTLASILPDDERGTFLIAGLTSEPAVGLFNHICSALGFEQVIDVRGLDREIGLLGMMGRF